MTDSVEDARPRILFVDDEPDLLAAMARNLENGPFVSPLRFAGRMHSTC